MLGTISAFAYRHRETKKKPVSRWPVAGPSENWLIASSPAFNVKKKEQYTHSTTNTHKITIHTSQLQQYTRSTNNNYPKYNVRRIHSLTLTEQIQRNFDRNLPNLVFRLVVTEYPFCFGCETWCVTSRDQHPDGIGSVYWWMCWIERKNVGEGDWRRVRNGVGCVGHYDLYCLPHVSRVAISMRIWWVGHVVCMGWKSFAYPELMTKPEGQKPIEGNGRREEDNIKMVFKGIGWKFLHIFVCLGIRKRGGLLWPR